MSQNQPHLIVICGLPGSGKTTLAMEIARSRRALRFSPDEWMERLGIDIWDANAREKIEALQWDLIQELLTTSQVSIVIEWGTWARAEHDLLRERAHQLGATAELHYLDVSPAVLWGRITSRGLEARAGSRAMTYADLLECYAALEPPSESELVLYDVAEVHLTTIT